MKLCYLARESEAAEHEVSVSVLPFIANNLSVSKKYILINNIRSINLFLPAALSLEENCRKKKFVWCVHQK